MTTPIPDLPETPLPSQNRPDFEETAETFLLGLQPWADAANVLGDEMEALAGGTSGDAASAAASAEAAALSALSIVDYNGTSNTSLTIGAGSKSLTVEANKRWVGGTWVTVVDMADPATNFMDGRVVSYDDETGAMEIYVEPFNFGGSGTYTAWVISLSARQKDVSAQVAAAEAAQAAAEGFKDEAAQSAAYAGGFETPEYADQATGNTATTAGQIFRVPKGTTPQTFDWYRRLVSGSELVDPLATTTALAGAGGAGLVRKGAALVSDLLPTTPDEFYEVGDPDDTASIIRAEEFCYTNGKPLTLKGRQYFYSDDLTFRCEVFGEGVDTTWLVKTAPATIYHEEGAFKGIKIAPLTAAIIPGDTTDGFVATNVWRKDIEIRTEYHGGNGFVFEGGNLSRAKVYSRRNGERGIWCPLNATGDNNCLEIWAESSANGTAGFEIEAGGDTNMANCIRGFIISQNNGEADVILAGFEHDLTIYAEYAPVSAELKADLESSNIFFQVASYVTMIDNTTVDTNTISYTHGVRGNRRMKRFRAEQIIIKNQDRVGNLRINQTADRTYVIAAEGSGSEQTLSLSGNLVLRNKDNRPIPAQIFKGATLNFGTIAAGASAEQTITFDTTPLTNSVVSAMPRTALGAGVSFYVYVEDASPTVARIVMTNHTASSFTDSNRAWRAQALSL